MQRSHDYPRAPERQTASQLAEMGYCERKVLLKHRYGTRVAPSRSNKQQRGTTEHERYLAEALRQVPRVISDHQPHATQSAASTADAVRGILADIEAILHRLWRRIR